MIDQAEMLKLLRDYVFKFSYDTEAAQSLGISPPYLSDILKGHRNITDTVARQLGYERVIMYKKVGR